MENVTRLVMREKLSPANIKKIMIKRKDITDIEFVTLLDYIKYGDTFNYWQNEDEEITQK